MSKKILLLLALVACAPTLSKQGADVSVFEVPQAAAPDTKMPDGCKVVATKAPVKLTEREMFGQKDPYRVMRNEAGAAGANALLVRSHMIIARRDFDCPAKSPITDCPGSDGAWYEVTFESYSCTSDALLQLMPAKVAR